MATSPALQIDSEALRVLLLNTKGTDRGGDRLKKERDGGREEERERGGGGGGEGGREGERMNESLMGNGLGTICGLFFQCRPETELQFERTNCNMNNNT